MAYTVQFDKTYLEGTLAGLCIPGQTVIFPTRERADQVARSYRNCEFSDDFMRDCATGNKFKVSNIAVFLSDPQPEDPMGNHWGENR